MEPQLDEVARQRQKHRAASLSQPVAGFPAMTVGQLADQVRAATPGAGTADGVTEFLRSSGHSHETIVPPSIPRPASGDSGRWRNSKRCC